MARAIMDSRSQVYSDINGKLPVGKQFNRQLLCAVGKKDGIHRLYTFTIPSPAKSMLPPKDVLFVYLPISKLYSILAVANLLAHNNISQICYCGQNSLQSAAINYSFSDNITLFWGNIYFAGDGIS